MAFPALRLKPGLVLRAHVENLGDGFSHMYAVQAGAPPSDLPSNPLADPETVLAEMPPAPQALPHFMDAVTGDGSPRSYLEASLFFRAASDFGASWHGVAWGHHRLIDAEPALPITISGRWREVERRRRSTDPADQQWYRQQPEAEIEAMGGGPPTPPGVWHWVEEASQEWRPSVTAGPHQVTVVFHSFTELGQQAIYRHKDVYRHADYRPDSTEELLASAGGGYVV